MQTWLILLFQQRREEGKETFFSESIISFSVPFNLIEHSGCIKSALRQVLVIDVYFYPVSNEIQIDLWNDETTVMVSEQVGTKPPRAECTYQNFMKLVREAELLAAKVWGGE